MKRFKLFGIDLQNAFGKEGHPLCVPVAPQDMVRIASLIRNNSQSIEDIVLTLDTHPEDHIGHPGWWAGEKAVQFTLVTPADLASGAIRPADPQQAEYAREYLDALKAVMVWPVHCVPGTESHSLVDCIAEAVDAWKTLTGREATKVKKGFNRDTEAFGVFAAEFDNHEIGSDFNWHLLADLLRGELPIVVVGEALSHCLRRSIEQLEEALGNEGHLLPYRKIVLLTDCTSNVPGFEADGADFLARMDKAGLTIGTSDQLEALLEKATAA